MATKFYVPATADVINGGKDPATARKMTRPWLIAFNNLVNAVTGFITGSGGLVVSDGAGGVATGDLSGDVSTSGSTVTTLANTAVTPGTYGDASHVAQVTVDQKGRITAATNVVVAGGGTVTHTGALTANQLVVGNGTPDIKVSDLTGDVTTSGGVATTLAASGVTAATYGDATHVPQIAVDAKGRITAASNVAISGGGSGNVTSTGPVGSEPGSPASGDLYLTTDGCAVERYSGTAWVPFGPLFPFTIPVNAGWSWVNQGGATVTFAKNAFALTAPAAAGDQVRAYVQTAPATPYTITAVFLPLRPTVTFMNMGLLFLESGSGKMVSCAFNYDGASNVSIDKFNSATSYSATYTKVPWIPLTVLFLRITDDGANRVSSVSCDGQNWLQIHSVTRTDFLTADQVGFFVNSNNATWPGTLTLLSWLQT